MAEPATRSRRSRKARVLLAVKAALVILALVLAGQAIASQWSRVRGNLGALSLGWTSLSAGLALAGLVTIALAWREVLAALGSPLPTRVAGRVFLIAQLGKYIPGSVFALAGQMELATRYDVPRRRAGTASLVTLGLNVAAGGVVAVVAVPLLPSGSAQPYLPVLLLLPLVGLLHPRPLNALLDRGLRLLHRPGLDLPMTGRGVARALGWCLSSWVLLGLHVWALCRDVGAQAPVAALAVTGFAAAWLVGFLVVLAPAGFGPREAVLVGVLGGSLVGGSGAALVVAAVSRLILVVADVVLAGLAWLVGHSPVQHRNALAVDAGGQPAPAGATGLPPVPLAAPERTD